MKKINILTTILFALLGISQAWADTAKIEGSDWNNNRSWSGSHVTFTFAGDNTSYSDGITGTYLQVKANTTYIVSWAVDACYTINVTQIKGKFGNAGTSAYDIYYNSTKCGSVKGWRTNDNVYLNNLSLGNNGSISLSTTGDANIYWIEITYTITPYPYSVIFHADDATDGTMANQAFAYGTAQNLTTNAFERSYTVTYNANSGECDETSATAEYTFAGWATSANGAVVYTDGQSVSNLTTVKNGEVNLYAKWNSASVTLPVATKEGSLFNGWYDGETWIGKAGDAIVPTAGMALTAQWVDKLIPQFVLDKTEIELDQKAVLTLTHVDNPTVQIAPEGLVEYNAENGEMTGIGLGEATITITQAGTSTIAAKTESLKLNVTRKTPSLAVVLANVEQNNITINPSLSASVGFNKVSDAEVEVSPVSGSEYATYSDGVVTAFDKVGTAVFRATLPETDTYKATSADFSVEVAFAAESDESYVLVEEDQHSIGAYDNNKGLEYTLLAPGKTLYVKVGKYSNVATNNMDIYGYRADGSEVFHTEYAVSVLTTSGEDKIIDIAADVVKIKFIAGGTLSKWFSNVRVTRRGFVEPSADAIQTAPTIEGAGTLAVKYSIANGGDLKISCDNDKFTLDSYTITNVVNKSGTVNIPVTFAAQATECDEEANIVIYNGVYRQEYKLTAKVRKITPEITTLPTASDITYGQKLSESTLSDGDANGVEGTFAWADDTEELNVGEYDKEVIFTPANTDVYTTATCSVHVTVNKIIPEVTAWPTAATITYGQQLSESVLTGGAANVEGEFSWVNAVDTLDAGEYDLDVIFTPSNTDIYETVTSSVHVTVNQKEIEIVEVNPDTVFLEEGEELTNILQKLEKVLAKIFGDIQEWLTGIFTLNTTQTEAQEGDEEYDVIFTPDDTNLAPAATKVRVSVAKTMPTGFENIENGKAAVKVLKDGKVLIYRDGKVYTVTGLKIE